MAIYDIFQKKRKNLRVLAGLRKKENGEQERKLECPDCKALVSHEVYRKNLGVCPDCGYYFCLSVSERVQMIADENTFREMKKDLKTKNPLNFPQYESKLEVCREKCNSMDAATTGVCKIGGIAAAIGILDGQFLMGSMGTVVGEKITLLAEYAQRKNLPLILFSASGGARMQEGIFSLMQMVKTSAAVEKYKSGGGLFVSVLTNPTTGGVSASFATLGDIILAEPRALIGFAGPRVIEQTIGQKLPDGFQRSEFLLEHGMIDRIVERVEMKAMLYHILKMHQGKK